MKCRRSLYWASLILSIGIGIPAKGLSQQSKSASKACPVDIEQLGVWLSDDLPSYSNRVIQRSQLSQSPLTYIVVAGKPEFAPLPLSNRQFDSSFGDRDLPQQIFLTTLERHYLQNRATNFQSYYWIFLTRTTEGWGLVQVVTQLISLNPNDPPLPPRDATDGIVGQAIRTWLRDCRAGSLLVQRHRSQP
jgi:hypothetical protein